MKYDNIKSAKFISRPNRFISNIEEEDGIVMFPDAPTKRGLKHLYELSDSLDEDYEAYVCYVIHSITAGDYVGIIL